jgi:two-component system nitrate/nitrite response regulator NarL
VATDQEGAACARVAGKQRVLLIEAQVLMRVLVRDLINSQSGYRVIGEASDCVEALALAAATVPDLILLDHHIVAGCMVDGLSRLRAAAPAARILLLTGASDSEGFERAIRLGVRGIVFKSAPPEVLLKAIEKVCAGELWLDRSLMRELIDAGGRQDRPGPQDSPRAKIERLTPRECEVIGLLCEGGSNKAIAKKLAVAEITVRHHLSAIFAKLGVASRVALVVFAYQHGLASLPN